jgi:RNA polymerase sigma-70 factor, ECF subfamily
MIARKDMKLDAYTEKTDEELVRMTLSNQALFAILVERYEDKLRRYIHRITNVTKEDCDDILQEVFINVYKNLAGFDTSLSFSSWIYRITHNYVRSQFRKKQARPQSIEIAAEILENISSDEDLYKIFETQLTKEIIRDALTKLDEKYKTVLILKFLEEKDYKEISDIIQKPIGTVGTLINRAKKKLKIILEKDAAHI